MLSLIHHSSGSAFLASAEGALAQNEAANNLIYGLALRLAADPQRFERLPYTPPPFLATVQEGGELVCAALMTPPYRLVIFAQSDTLPDTLPDAQPDPLSAAFDLLIAHLQSGGWRVPGVTVADPVGPLFAERWRAATGDDVHVELRLRAFELHAVDWPPVLPPGRLRPGALEDAPLVHQWYCDFTTEAIPGDPLPTREGVERAIGDGSIYLWDDGGPVSLAARGRRLPHGSSVGPVYTPPALRGRGYASACVAALSQAILDAGASYCTLFTDLSNPTSNAIYQRIGYRPVCDYVECKFERVSG